MLKNPGRWAKAIVSAVVSGSIAFLTSVGTALQGEHTGWDTITAGQWVTAITAGLVGLGLTGAAAARTTNRPASTSTTVRT